MLVGGSAPGNIWGPADGGTEGPERGAEARSAGAPRGWGLGRGAVAPPQYGGQPPENFRKINVEIAHFRSFVMLQFNQLQLLACDTS